jgi:hypothetical protein
VYEAQVWRELRGGHDNDEGLNMVAELCKRTLESGTARAAGFIIR